MSITYDILGDAGRDNALLVRVDSGQAVERLLFDCGDGCVARLPFADIQAIDRLFFSHLHMDHIGGFDNFFRCTFDRETKPNQIWGPPDTARILQHRFQGFLWNLHDDMRGTWRVHEVQQDRIQVTRFELREAFAIVHDEGSQPFERVIWDGQDYSVEAVTMDHRTPTLAYVVREKSRQNIDTSRLASLGLSPGPWLRSVKESSDGSGEVAINGVVHSIAELRRKLVVETSGDSIAYLTDFLLDENATTLLADVLRGCKTIVCEGQYSHADLDLAKKNFHMTTVLSATLASRASASELVLFHLSDRYERETWEAMLRQAQEVFANTRFPVQWNFSSIKENH